MIDPFQEIFTRRGNGFIKPGLERMKEALKYFTEPLPPAILVAGTNGKGTTSGFLWQMLSRHLERVGLYTSPHILHFRERIQCSHRSFETEELLAGLKHLTERLPTELYQELSFFELTTLLAFEMFTRERCDLMILEVGLGGRFDATNVVDPLLSCVVSVDFDHTEYLGSTWESIAYEKLGVGRRRTPLFWGESFSERPRRPTDFFDRMTSQFERVYFRDVDFSHDLKKRQAHVQGTSYLLPEEWLAMPQHLQSNFVLALAMAQQFLQDQSEQLIKDEIASFYATEQRFPPSFWGRSQTIKVSSRGQDRSLLVDVSHNPAAIRELVRLIKERFGHLKLPAAVGILRDKDISQMIFLLREVCDPIMMFKLSCDRTWRDDDLGLWAEDIETYESFAELWQARSHEFSLPLVVCGSFFAVGQVFEYFGINTDQKLVHLPGIPPRLRRDDGFGTVQRSASTDLL